MAFCRVIGCRACTPDVVRVVERAIQITTQDFRVQEGLRTRERQAALTTVGSCSSPPIIRRSRTRNASRPMWDRSQFVDPQLPTLSADISRVSPSGEEHAQPCRHKGQDGNAATPERREPEQSSRALSHGRSNLPHDAPCRGRRGRRARCTRAPRASSAPRPRAGRPGWRAAPLPPRWKRTAG